MLPPQLQHGLRHGSVSTTSAIAIRSSASSIVRCTAACTQARSFWGWKRPSDYASQIDPMYHRFSRYRTLKTRAKLIDKIRRRGRWDWDLTQRPFFTPKHVRLAHHIGRPKWKSYEDPKKQGREEEVEDGFELSKREKEWKDQMEAMRKRIEQDPYEAIFGKRFEPFWSPLVPSWMREEMGLDRSCKPKESKKPDTVPNPIPAKPVSKESKEKPSEPVRTRERSQSPHPKRDDADSESPNGQLTTYSYTSKKAMGESDAECPNGQLTNYSYGSATSWDSWTKTTRREEWDSISGQTRRYEYDPISNRMVQIEAADITKPFESKKLGAKDQAPTSKTEKAVDIPVKTSTEPRKAIPVPTQTTESTTQKTSVYFPSLLNTSVISSTPKPSSLATRPEKDLDLLTAEDVRASMGKAAKESSTPEALNEARAYRHGKVNPEQSEWEKAENRVMHERLQDRLRQQERIDKLDLLSNTLKLETALNRQSSKEPAPATSSLNSSPLKPSLERMQSRELPPISELDDSAAHESTGDRIDYSSTNVPKDWTKQADLLQADRIRRTRGINVEPRKLDMNDVKKGEVSTDGKPRWIDMMKARKAKYDVEQAAVKAQRETQDAEKNMKLAKMQSLLNAEVDEQKMHMQAHENRYIHKIRTLRQELDTAYKQSSVNAEMQVERIRNLEQELERLQKATGDKTEITKWQSESERYQQKVKDLRKELETTFKQSSANAEMQTDLIQQLRKDLEKAQKESTGPSQVEKERYVAKIKSLREELDRTFKQSAAHGDKHVERIRELERELEEARRPASNTSKGPEVVQAEGDFSVNVCKYAKDSTKWYKQPSYIPEATGKPSPEEIQKATQKQKDRELVKDLRNIYERRYGTIDAHHRQSVMGKSTTVSQATHQSPQVVEVESDVDLGKALADYEAGQSYEYRRDNLEAEIAAQEQEAHEAQALMAPESSGKMKRVIAKNLALDQDVHGARIVDDNVPRLIPTEIAARSEPAKQPTATPARTEANNWGIVWEEPPVYKVLAYDSGNDMFSSATTSSNFTGSETPISIPQALSELYQPARFVPHFAELQKDGYQVIYGTKDLLVFKKAKTATEPTSTATAPKLADHGLVKPTSAEPIERPQQHQPGVNPIDGTTYPLEPESAGFASPTGFVGDRWEALASEGRAQSPSTVSKPDLSPQDSGIDLKSPHSNYSQPADEETEFDIRHYPRVKREERVFSGSRLQRPKRRRHHHEPSADEVKDMKKKWNSYRSRVRWALGVGLGASAVAYCVGAAAEKKEQREMERWQQILEGRRGRWE